MTVVTTDFSTFVALAPLSQTTVRRSRPASLTGYNNAMRPAALSYALPAYRHAIEKKIFYSIIIFSIDLSSHEHYRHIDTHYNDIHTCKEIFYSHIHTRFEPLTLRSRGCYSTTRPCAGLKAMASEVAFGSCLFAAARITEDCFDTVVGGLVTRY